ncbi:hypothetical protein WOLCODRAFT_142513 [Wolfiporia cocos MD-104 SS10]|uniref:Uncharacterized protein n=1 Tax=Wolfiporia cocos (strain MD-104) TaxID=742152 RepID=A0A2H3J8T7_WOLCO|nr:hypothetical protein WOLCODRAFT_142513 [Wolfiporia cocos MD-104 SS10]
MLCQDPAGSAIPASSHSFQTMVFGDMEQPQAGQAEQAREAQLGTEDGVLGDPIVVNGRTGRVHRMEGAAVVRRADDSRAGDSLEGEDGQVGDGRGEGDDEALGPGASSEYVPATFDRERPHGVQCRESRDHSLVWRAIEAELQRFDIGEMREHVRQVFCDFYAVHIYRLAPHPLAGAPCADDQTLGVGVVGCSVSHPDESMSVLCVKERGE